MKTVLLFLCLLFCRAACAQTIDAARSEVSFKVKNMGLERVTGTFSSVYGQVKLDPERLSAATIKAVVDISSLSTENELRDNHLLGSHFFDVERHPTAVFISQSIRKTDTGYLALGVLEVKGAREQVQIPFTLLNHTKEQLLLGTLTLHRKHFDLGNDVRSVTIGNEVQVQIKCYVVK